MKLILVLWSTVALLCGFVQGWYNFFGISLLRSF